MREEADNRFDLLIRETMEDAEVRVPSRVWKAVSARIGATTPSAGVMTSLWKWAVPSLAAAAVVLFFIVSGISEKTIIQNGALALRVETPSCSFEPSLCAADVKPLTLKERTFASLDAPAGALLAFPDDTPTEAPTEAPAEIASEIPSEILAELPVESPFEFPEKPKAETKRTVLLVGGSLGTNDTHYSKTGFGPMFAGGTKVPDLVEEQTQSEYAFPISFGIGVKYYFTDRLALGTGINWTLLSRSFTGSYKTETGKFTHEMHYIGVPLNLYCDVFQRKGLQLYVYAGGKAEKAVSNSWYIYDKSASPICSQKVKGLQWGVDLGFGVEFKVSEHLALYLDPSVDYWFAGSQPKSIRTEKPLLFSFDGGLRIIL